jgi:hypothetical protein
MVPRLELASKAPGVAALHIVALPLCTLKSTASASRRRGLSTIANDLVLVPTFNDANDRVALGILANLMPSRTVVGPAVDRVCGTGFAAIASAQREPHLEGLESPPLRVTAVFQTRRRSARRPLNHRHSIRTPRSPDELVRQIRAVDEVRVPLIAAQGAIEQHIIRIPVDRDRRQSQVGFPRKPWARDRQTCGVVAARSRA